MAAIDLPDGRSGGLQARPGHAFWPRLREHLPRLFTGTPTGRGGLGDRGINLALQGGGAFGAFTWGVLDRLLAEETFRPAAVSGASAGALNAAVMASGYLKDGRSGARAALGTFWAAVAQSASLAYWTAPLLWTKNGLSRSSNPLGDILKSAVDVRRLKKQAPFPLFIAATNARTFQTRIFTETDLSLDALLASACLPQIHDTVWIRREPYWDGGLSANPPLLPLVEAGFADRTLLVKLLPSGDAASGDPTRDIAAGLRLAAFARPLEAELEHFAHLRDLARQSSRPVPPILSRSAAHRLEVIDGAAVLAAQNRESLPTPALVRQLHDAGQAAAEAWLAEVPA
jgi:NTE family protein